MKGEKRYAKIKILVLQDDVIMCNELELTQKI
jgi:hypothetical protein